MRYHLIVNFYEPLPDGARIPSWLDFINNKSVVVENATPEIDHLMADLGLKFWLTHEFQPAGGSWNADEIRAGLDRFYRLILQQDDPPPPGLVERLRQIPAVKDAHELYIGKAELPTPRVAQSASLPVRPAAELIYLPYAKAITRGNPRVKIAVLDTGVDLNHPELAGKILKRADFVDLSGLDTSGFIGDITGYDDQPDDEVGHGTHVSGIVAARGEQMDEGVAPACSLMAVRVLATMQDGDRKVGAGIVDNINSGIKWAVDNGADVINMSLGIRHEGGGLPHESVIRYALSKEVTVVAASGNDGTAERYYPGALPGVIAVGAVDDQGTVTSFTSYGANISVVAPGLRIYSSWVNDGYALASGTSQASPFVAGAVGLFKAYALERGKSLTNHEIMYILKNTSDKIDSRLRDEHAGYGLINMADSFKLLEHVLA